MAHTGPGGAASSAWTGVGDEVAQVGVDDHCFMLNPYFQDGTRLRLRPEKESPFGDKYILNDAEVVVLDLAGDGFVKVSECDCLGEATEGWVRQRNLVRERRTKGLNLPPKGKESPPGPASKRTTVSSLLAPTVDDGDLAKQKSSAGVERLMALNGVSASHLTESEKALLKKSLNAQAASIRKQCVKPDSNPHPFCSSLCPSRLQQSAEGRHVRISLWQTP